MRHKESSTLVAVEKGKEASHVRSPARGAKTSTSTFPFPLITANPRDLVARQNTKRLLLWFQTWHAWQQRTFICRMMEHCSRQHLELLVTALEPILHLDFSSSLVPHLASLHLDGAATFQVQRSVLQSMIRPEILEAEDSLAYLGSIPTTLLTDSVDHSQALTANDSTRIKDTALGARGVRSGRESILPAIPLTHVKHIPPFSLSHQSLEDIVALRRERFGSVPDFKSTTDLLKNVRHKERLRPRQQVGHRRSKSVGACPSVKPERSRGGRRVAEHFKGQLVMASDVSVL